MEKLIEPIAKTGLRPSLIHLGEGKVLINLFDNDHYSQNDFDVIDSYTRNLLLVSYKAAGWSLKGARCFFNGEYSVNLAKPSHTLGANPSQKVLEEFDRGHKVVFSTPTQTLLILAHYYRTHEAFWKGFDIYSFLEKTPANLQAFFYWMRQDDLQKGFCYSLDELMDANERVLKSKINK